MYTLEEWDALSEEEQLIHADEKPEAPAGNKGAGTPTVETLTADVKKLTENLASIEEEKGGLIRDVQDERRVRQQLQDKVNQLEQALNDKGEPDLFAGKADDDMMTIADIKALIKNLEGKAAKSNNANSQAALAQKASSNYTNDEERMVELDKENKLRPGIPYKEAIKEFERMAKAKPGLMLAVAEESRRDGGKPAETAYNIALTSPIFIARIEKGARENIVKELVNQGKLRPTKIPGGGSGTSAVDPNLLSETDLMNLSDAELDKLLAENT